MYPKIPASNNALITCSPVSVPTSFLPKSTNSCFSSASTLTQSTFLRSPRTTSRTVPLTGEANLTSGYCLLTNRASPALTLSPSLTTTFGVTPSKSSGTSANLPFDFSWIFFSSALPSRVMSKPLRNLITFAIYIRNL